jgi:predicted phosphoribosyltransferase
MFRSVGQWYDEFDQTSDAEVQDLLAAAGNHQPKGGANDETTDFDG